MTIVVCTYQRREVYTTIRMLCLLIIPLSNLKLLVIDNEGNSELKEFCEDIGVEYFYERVLGLSHARNAALNLTKNEWVYFVDDDVYVTEELLEELSLNHDKARVLYSYVVPAVLPVIEGEFVAYSLANSLSIHGSSIMPIGCSFGFYNSGDLRFDVTLGRVGRNLAGEEENVFISELMKKGHSLKLLRGAVVHRIGDKLHLNYVQGYFKNQILSTGKNRRLRILFHVLRSTVSRNSRVYRKALMKVYRDL